MSIEVVLPVLPEAPPKGAVLAPRTGQQPGDRVVGLVNNGKHRADALLSAIAELLVDRGIAQAYTLQTKARANTPMTANERAVMLARSHMVITGVGD